MTTENKKVNEYINNIMNQYYNFLKQNYDKNKHKSKQDIEKLISGFKPNFPNKQSS